MGIAFDWFGSMFVRHFLLSLSSDLGGDTNIISRYDLSFKPMETGEGPRVPVTVLIRPRNSTV